ncbi:MAG: ATP-binding protein [Clostridiales Family XIII bacterium]|jgi:AAA+ ATPase superfamily predicted ATPase|nr:ATP-binding protein [Clostridiales Family XIII bacterium]
MKFYDRTRELEILSENRELALESSRFTVVYGRRRVGKTALILESMKDIKGLYLFISRKNEALLCAEFQQEIEAVLGLRIYGAVLRFRDLFEQLLMHSEKESFTLVLDEFQEFERVNPSVFGEMQDLWDRHKAQSRLNLIVCGSAYSLMTKIFEDQKEPLFGRLTSKITLRPFSPSVIREILSDHNPAWKPEDILCLYMLSGGSPQYIHWLLDVGANDAERMLQAVASTGSPFISEGKDLLISEFGKEYGTYFSILQLIASGKTSQSEIDSVIGKNTGAYLQTLEQTYTLITRNRPMFSNPRSRNIKWKIHDQWLRFWFRFIYPRQALIETRRFDLLLEFIRRDYAQFSGQTLEQYFRDKLAEEERITRIGGYWDSKGMNEIDIVALNELDHSALIVEVKRNPQRIDLVKLRAKAEKLTPNLEGYKVEYRALSLDDV